MTCRNIHRRPLTELQQAILDIIWKSGPATSEQVREALLPGYPLKDSSMRTLLRRLESREYLTHRVDGEMYVYEAAIQRGSVAARAVRQIIDRFCSGSTEQFLMGLVDERVLTAKELQRLAKKVRGT